MNAEEDEYTSVDVDVIDDIVALFYGIEDRQYLSETQAVITCLDIYAAFCRKIYNSNAPIVDVGFFVKYNGANAITLAKMHGMVFIRS